ncbi:MAG: metal-dependent hydrolase [Elusimicrobia bacterium]|nr:metal-dependent hydrolase [Elusimicrobiota bacterium]
MDPLSHGLLGYLLAKGGAPQDASLKPLLPCIGGAVLPDLDVFFPLGLEGPLVTHRSATHSFVGGALLATALAVGLRWWRPQWKFPYLWLAAYVGVLSHLLGDWATSYGTPLFLPFITENFSLDLISNLELVLLGGMALTVIALWRWPRQGPRILGVAGLIGLGYLGGRLWTKHAAIERVNQRLSIASSVIRIAALPSLLNPLAWRVIVITSDRYVVSELTPWTQAPRERGFPRPRADDPALLVCDQSSLARRLSRNSRFPLVLSRPAQNGGIQVLRSDLLFVRGRYPRFGVLLEADASGTLRSQRRFLVSQAWDVERGRGM